MSYNLNLFKSTVVFLIYPHLIVPRIQIVLIRMVVGARAGYLVIFAALLSLLVHLPSICTNSQVSHIVFLQLIPSCACETYQAIFSLMTEQFKLVLFVPFYLKCSPLNFTIIYCPILFLALLDHFFF